MGTLSFFRFLPQSISDIFSFVALSMPVHRLLSMNTVSNGKMKITYHGISLNMLISRFVVLSLHLRSILSTI